MLSITFPKQLVWKNIAFIVPALFLTVALTDGARSWLAVASPTQMPASITPQNESAQASHTTRAEVLTVTMTPTGFYPSELTRPSDPFILQINNKSGLEDVIVQVHRIQNNERSKMLDVQLMMTRSKKQEALKLPPGRYQLTEANNPNWSCSLVITAR